MSAPRFENVHCKHKTLVMNRSHKYKRKMKRRTSRRKRAREKRQNTMDLSTFLALPFNKVPLAAACAHVAFFAFKVESRAAVVDAF